MEKPFSYIGSLSKVQRKVNFVPSERRISDIQSPSKVSQTDQTDLTVNTMVIHQDADSVSLTE